MILGFSARERFFDRAIFASFRNFTVLAASEGGGGKILGADDVQTLISSGILSR